MADRSIKLNLTVDANGAVTGFTNARKGAEGLDKSLGKIGGRSADMQALSGQIGKVGLGVTALAGLAVKKFADFDQAMSSVAATGEDARKSIDALRQASIDAGADTAFSATEAAGAVEELAKAGVAASDILGGGLAGSLDLAAAGGLGVAEAAEYASIAMTQFKLEGKDVTHVADLLAAGAGKAMGDVSDLGQALKQGGLVASATGLSIEETTGSLAAFAAAGLLGSDAGTSLKTMLQRLSAPTGEAKDLMDSLGISAYDAAGQFVGMETFASQLTDALGDMTPAQRNAALATMFGADAVRAANVIYENGETGIRDWIAAVDDQGYAAETAATKMDNLKGDLESLGGSFETLLIGMGEGADGPLRSLVQGLDGVVDRLNALPDPIKQGTILLVGGGGLVALGVAGMVKLTAGIASAKTTMDALNLSTGKTGRAMALLGKAGAVAAVGQVGTTLMSMSAQARVGSSDVEKLAADLTSLADGGAAANKSLDLIFRNQQAISWLPWVKDVETAEQATVKFADTAYEALATGFFQKVDRFVGGGSDMARFEKQVTQLDAAFAAMVEGGAADQAEAQYAAFTQAAVDNGVAIEDLVKFFPQYEAAIKGAAAETEAAAPEAQTYAEALEEQAAAADDAWASIKALADGMLGLRDTGRGYEAALDDATKALKENGKTLDITTEKGRANQAALDGVASAGWAHVDALREQGASEDDLQGAMKRTRTDFIKTATQMGMNKAEAKRLADELGLIPSKITTDVTVNTDTAMADLKKIFDFASGKFITIPVRTAGSGLFPMGPQKKATGGGVSGPGTGTSDSIPAMLSNGEHVWTASEVAKAGGQGAMYRARGLVQAGLLRFAKGGAVSISGVLGMGDPVADAKARVQRERQQVKAAEKAVERAQSASTRASRASADTSSKNKAAKNAAKKAARDAQDAVKAAQKHLKSEKAQLKAGEKALAAERKAAAAEKAEARKARADEEQRRSDIRGLRAEHETDVRRGTIRDQVSSGLSGGLSAVDSMLALAGSGTLSEGKSAELRAVAQQAEKDLTAQYKIIDETNKKIAEQTALLGDVKGMRDQIAQQMMGEVKLSELLGQKTAWGHDKPVTAGAVRAYVQDKLTKAQKFNSSLEALRQKGAPNALLREVLGAGIEGGTQLAEALLGSSASDWTAITSTWTALESESRRTGDIGTLSAFGTTTAAVEADLAKQTAIAEDTKGIIAGIGRILESSTGIALQGYASGGWLSGGVAGKDSIPILGMPGEYMVNATSARANAGLLEAINASSGPVAAPMVAMPSMVSTADIVAALAGIAVMVQVGLDRPTQGRIVLNGSREAGRTDAAAIRHNLGVR